MFTGRVRQSRNVRSDHRKHGRAHRSQTLAELLEPRRLLSQSALITRANIPGLSDQDSLTTQALAIDANGNLFGATKSSILEIPSGAGAPIVLASFDPTVTGPPAPGVVLDSHGNLFGLAGVGQNVPETIYELPAGSHVIVQRLAFSTNDVVLYSGLTADPSGDLFYLGRDQSNSPSLLKLPAGSHTPVSMSVPLDTAVMASDAAGDLFTLRSTFSGQSLATDIIEISTATGTTQTLATIVGPGTDAPHGPLLCDDQGNLYGTISSTISTLGEIFELPAGGHEVMTLASGGLPGGINGGLARDAEGDLFGTVGDFATDGPRIVELPAGGTDFVTLVGSDVKFAD